MITNSMQFDDVFGMIGTRTQLTFVSESYPLKAEINASEALHTLLASFESAQLSGETTRANITSIALLYDYDCEFSGNIVMMRKRFVDPDDLPSVTYEESEAFLENLLTLAGKFHHTNATGADLKGFLTELYANLSDQQRLRMQDGFEDNRVRSTEGGVEVSRLTSEQRDILWQALINQQLDQPLAAAQRTVANMKDIKRQNAPLRWFQENNMNYYGCELIRNGKPYVVPISHDAAFMPSEISSVQNEDDKEKTEQRKFVSSNPSREQHTINSVPKGIVTIDQYLKSRSTSSSQFAADSGIGKKLVGLYGPHEGNSLEVVGAIVRMYALAIDKQNDRSHLITIKKAKSQNTIATVIENVESCIPNPLLRYLYARSDKRFVSARTFQDNDDASTNPKEDLNTKFHHSEGTLRDSAIHRFKQHVVPESYTSEGRVLFSQLDDEAKNALGLRILSSCFASVGGLFGRTTMPLINFDQSKIHGKIVDSSEGKFLFVSITTPEQKPGASISMGWWVPAL